MMFDSAVSYNFDPMFLPQEEEFISSDIFVI